MKSSAKVLLHKGRDVLLQRRTLDAPGGPGMWTMFGGEIEDGESPERAAVREMQEELGIELQEQDLEMIGRFGGSEDHRIGIVHFFAAPLTVELSELRLGEGAGFSLYRIEELDQLNMAPHARMAAYRYFESKGLGWID